QLRVGTGLQQTLRPDLCGLRDAAPRRQGQRALVRRIHRGPTRASCALILVRGASEGRRDRRHPSSTKGPCAMADVRFEHVTKRYGQQAPVITDLNLSIADHEFLVLVGPSGCGKSTALRMIAGLEEISTGDLYIGERRVNDVAPKDRDIAMVFQNYALYP